MKISEIFAEHNTDKVNGHHYGQVYDDIFSRFKADEKLNIIEIGTQRGGATIAFQRFFPNATVTSVDIVDVVENKSDSINYVLQDIKEYKTDGLFDIVIDDGSHWLRDIVYVVDVFSKKLNKNGVIIIEDVQNPDLWWQVIHDILSPNLEYNKDYRYTIEYSDLRKINNQYDDFVIIITRI